MAFPRGGAGDQRRRRALIEEHLQAEASQVGDDSQRDVIALAPRTPSRRYAQAAEAERQAAMTAVIPQRAWTLLVLMLGGLCAIAASQAYYGQAALRPADSWLRAGAAWDVARPGGMASWLSSIALLTAGFQGLQIYRLRRHRADDYRGRYRVWLWVSPALLLGALAAGTHLHRDLLAAGALALEIQAGWRLELIGTAAPVAVWLLIAVRLAFELRECRLAVVDLSAATIAYAAAALVASLLPVRPLSLTVPMLSSSLLMLGHLAVFLAVAVYARHVYRDTQSQPDQAAESVGRRAAAKRPAAAAKGSAGSASTAAAPAAAGSTASGASAAQSPETPAASAGRRVGSSPPAGAAGESPQTPEVISLSGARGRQTGTAAEPRADKPTRSSRPTTAAAEESSAAGAPSAGEQKQHKSPPGADDDDSDEVAGGAESRLSRAERRRLRKQQNREPARRAA